MSSTIGDYLFWKLAIVGARQVLGRGQRTLFIGSIQRNRLTHVDITYFRPSPSSIEVGVFVVSPDTSDLAACFEVGRQYFPGRPIIFVQELHSADFRSASNLTAGLTFAAATMLSTQSTAVSQIDQILDTMLYERRPVYIGVAPAVAGAIVSVSSESTTGSSASQASTGYSVSAEQVNAASAAVAMSFIH